MTRGAVGAVSSDAQAARIPSARLSRVAQEREPNRLPAPRRAAALDPHHAAVVFRGRGPEEPDALTDARCRIAQAQAHTHADEHVDDSALDRRRGLRSYAV